MEPWEDAGETHHALACKSKLPHPTLSRRLVYTCRIILRRPPPGSTSEECTAALAASSVSPQGLRVTYVKTKAGLAAAGDAAAWAGPAPMNMHA